jgi:hypothetical protein
MSTKTKRSEEELELDPQLVADDSSDVETSIWYDETTNKNARNSFRRIFICMFGCLFVPLHAKKQIRENGNNGNAPLGLDSILYSSIADAHCRPENVRQERPA